MLKRPRAITETLCFLPLVVIVFIDRSAVAILLALILCALLAIDSWPEHNARRNIYFAHKARRLAR